LGAYSSRHLACSIFRLLLCHDDSGDLLTLGVSTFLRSELSAGEFDGTLFLGDGTGLDEFDHLALEGGKSADLGDNLSDTLYSGVESSLTVRLGCSESSVSDGGFGDDESLVKSNEHSGSFCHLFSDIKEMAERTGMFVGLNKGFIVTRRELKAKPSHRQGRNTPRNKFVKEVIREVSGFAPYEKRMLELLKIGSAATFKRALKLAKHRLGTHRRGKKKRDEMSEAISSMRRKGGN